MANHRLGAGWSLSLPALWAGLVLAAGCASEVDGDGSSLSGSGGAGASANGGATAGGGGGAGGQSLCAQDCAAIDTPPCLVAVCNEGEYPGQVGACAVVDAPAGTACDDGLFCTVNDTCSAGMCVGGPQNDCDLSPPPCTEITCVESTQSCTTAPAENEAPCIPEDLCQVNGTCQSGLCVGHPKDCSFSPLSECNTVSCDSTTGACTATAPINDGQACALTGDLCMSGKSCNAGQCVGGTHKDCSAFTTGCNVGACNAATGSCFSDPIAPGGPCTDGIGACNVGVCSSAGTCDPTPTPGVSCSSGIGVCQVGICGSAGTCDAMPAMEGLPCVDATACTTGNTCVTGSCGVPDPGYSVYFSDTFADNSQGWTLDTDWQIGPTSLSSGGTGNPDPAMDHSPTGDNGVAGVVLGGNAPTNVHPFYYLTSPVINTGGAPGDVYLEFFRWLNSDYLPYMQNVIEVYDGSTWVQVWASGPPPAIMDSAWNKQTYNITAHKNANMRIRFGFTIGSSGVYTVSQWNVDDVTVASAPCN